MFKISNDRAWAARDLASAAETFPEKVRLGLEGFFAAHLRDGERLPDVEFLQELVRRALEANSGSVLAADASLTSALVDHAALRDERDRHAAVLRELLSRVRHFFDSALAPAAAQAILPVRRFSNMKPSLLAASARQAAASLRDPLLGWDQMTDGFGFAPPADMADILDAARQLLEQVLEQLAAQRAATQNRLGRKVEGIEAAADVTRRCKRFLEGLYRLAGLDFHADRL